MKTMLVKISLVTASLTSAAMLLLAQPAGAITGDGTNFIYCNNRYTIAARYWGKARMFVYGCSNNYVWVTVASTTNWAKGAGIVRNSPYASRYTATTGYSYYSTITPMLVYVTGTCYTATGWSMDSNYGADQAYKWCH